jgi:signal transduction histidine kinase
MTTLLSPSQRITTAAQESELPHSQDALIALRITQIQSVQVQNAIKRPNCIWDTIRLIEELIHPIDQSNIFSFDTELIIKLLLNFPLETAPDHYRHDLRNLLTIAVSNLELLHDGKNDLTQSQDDLNGFLTAFESIKNLLLNQTKPIQPFIEDLIIRLLKKRIVPHQIKITCLRLHLLHEATNTPNLCSAIQNILLNAIEELAQNPTQDPQIEISANADCNFFTIAITDNGRGMSPEIQAQVFQKFSTKNRGSGTGMYQMDSKLAQDNIGIKINSNSYGTTFTILIPRVINLSRR